MKFLICFLLSFLACFSVYAGKTTCMSNPKIEYSGDGGLPPILTNFAKTADEYFDKIKKDKEIVKNCGVYKDIRKEIYSIYNKALNYRKDGDVSGIGNGAIRSRAARCLKAMHYKMEIIGKKHMKEIEKFVQKTASAGTNMDYNVQNLFRFNQFCAPPATANVKYGGGIAQGGSSSSRPPSTSRSRGTPTIRTGSNTSCPDGVSLALKNIRGWRKGPLKIKFKKQERSGGKTSCFYSINNVGEFKLYSK